MTYYSAEAWRNLIEVMLQPVGSDDDVHAAIRVVTRALTSLEEGIHDTQTLVQQLVTSLGDYRQTAPALSHTPPASQAPTSASIQKAQLRIYSLGPFEIYCGEEWIPQRRTGKGRAILKYLAARPRQPVLRDVLLEVLWPETEPHIANNRLKVAMHHLRQAFALRGPDHDCGEYILFHNGCYLFNPNITVWTDVEAFEGHWRQGMRLERAGRLAEAIPFYLQAEMLYRGDFLAEDLFEEWTLVRREELKDLYLMTLDKLSRYWLQTGNADRAIEGWKKIIAKDPWREDAYRHLMVCFARCRQRELALRWYDLCVQTLQTQLGLEPEPETVALYQRIRSGESLSEWMD